MRKVVIIFLTLFSLNSVAQQKDTLRVMTYNLLYYMETTSFCTNSNNSVNAKNSAMSTIIDYTLPDILVVNEMGGGSSINAFRLLLNALNQNGRNYYSLANSTGTGSQSLVNMIYFDSRKLVLEGQTFIDLDQNLTPLVRGIDIYQLRLVDTNLSAHQDTVRIHVVAAHLKAGNSVADRVERAKATDTLMAYLDSNNAIGNYLLAGDLNLYTANENAYQDLINYSRSSLRFYDPINVAANWSNDSRFASLHTQSTSTSGGCKAGGGMDDRFDFILASDEIMNNTDHVSYLSNTYQALGQDGNRFNGSIVSPTNNSIPSAVSQALHAMSDHLPVLMDLEISYPLSTTIDELETDFNRIRFQNPTKGDLQINVDENSIEVIEIYDFSGRLIQSKQVRELNRIRIDISHFPKGTYLIKFIDDTYQQSVKKLIKI